ncbi:hypothetical protein ACFC6U_01550 [Kitasatospora purpeofusca]|uniref:hypothetical protein n=1 Tax=Kitasatospora purpeofusca TaxID=67352 RepID=UPI0035E2D9C0
MTVHSFSETNPDFVTGSDWYRESITVILPPGTPGLEELEDFLNPEHRSTEGYGLAFLESEEHSFTYVGTVSQIEEYRAAKAAGATLDVSLGQCYAFWPHGKGWDELLPATYWNAGREGLLSDFAHPLGGKVVVYEYLQDGPDGDKVPMVGFHCERCHIDPDTQSEAGMPNRGPQDRRWIARNARKHVRAHQSLCRPVDPRMSEVVTAVANEMYGTDNPVVTWESQCATTGACSVIRHLRAKA